MTVFWKQEGQLLKYSELLNLWEICGYETFKAKNTFPQIWQFWIF